MKFTNQYGDDKKKCTVFAKQVDDIWTADLVDMTLFSRSNKGYKYLLTVVDVFSKYGWIVPLKTKTDRKLVAFRKLFLDNAPSHLWTDKGTVLYNQQLKAVLLAINVTFYSTENEEKSSIVERWNRMMKNMWKYFTGNNTQVYRCSAKHGRNVEHYISSIDQVHPFT